VPAALSWCVTTGPARRKGRPRSRVRLRPAGAPGLFPVSCRGGPSTWMVVNVESGQITPVGDEHTDECEAFDRIGSYWVEGARTCTRGTSFYRDWHTGEEQGDGVPGGELRQPYDLDTATLRRLGPQRRLYVVGSSRVLSRVRTGHKRPRYAIELRGPGIRTRRSRCSGRCARAPSRVAWRLARPRWFEVARLRARERQRLTWDMPMPATVVGSTTSRVYYTTPNHSNPSVLRDLKSFRWR
jgi:hypothetical protein